MMEKTQLLTEVLEVSRAESQKIKEANRAETQKLFEASRTENHKLQAAIMKKMEDREQKFLSKTERKL